MLYFSQYAFIIHLSHIQYSKDLCEVERVTVITFVI